MWKTLPKQRGNREVQEKRLAYIEHRRSLQEEESSAQKGFSVPNHSALCLLLSCGLATLLERRKGNSELLEWALNSVWQIDACFGNLITQRWDMEQVLPSPDLVRSRSSLLSIVPTRMAGVTPPVEQRRTGSSFSSPLLVLHLFTSISKK